MLTKVKDTDRIILSKLDDKSLLNLCLVDNSLCQDDNFWRDRFIQNFQKFDKPSNVTWRQMYLKVLHYLGKEEVPSDLKDLFNINFFSIGLRKAAERGDANLVNGFLRKGGNVELGLIGAAKGGHNDLVAELIEKGGKNWNMAMSAAALGGHKDLIDFFIEKGANNWKGALYYAELIGRKDLIDFFKKKVSKF